jgi:hypothetical protein
MVPILPPIDVGRMVLRLERFVECQDICGWMHCIKHALILTPLLRPKCEVSLSLTLVLVGQKDNALVQNGLIQLLLINGLRGSERAHSDFDHETMP